MVNTKVITKSSSDEGNGGNGNNADEISELEHMRKLFIGGLNNSTTEDSLKAFYEQWGKIVDCVVMRDPTTQRSRGFGFITFLNSSMVDEAQNARPHVIDGKEVESKRALPRPDVGKPEANVSVRKIFVGGLKENHDEQCLCEYFQQFGNVLGVKIISDKVTGRKRGFGYIEFDDYDSVDKAVLQKIHTIKYVLVDVKKSVYKRPENQQNQQNMGQAAPGPYYPPQQYQQPPQPYPQQNWGYNGYQYQQPPPNWGYPPQNWGGYQQPQPGWGPPPAAPASGAVPAPAGGPPAVAPIQPVQQMPYPGSYQQPPVANAAPVTAAPPDANAQGNWGGGYNQSYSGGPTKNNSHLGSNRMNPYGQGPNVGQSAPQGNWNGSDTSGKPYQSNGARQQNARRY